eukprot:scaffold8378_cov113-Isochrysis_galbana.AAC.2
MPTAEPIWRRKLRAASPLTPAAAAACEPRIDRASMPPSPANEMPQWAASHASRASGSAPHAETSTSARSRSSTCWKPTCTSYECARPRAAIRTCIAAVRVPAPSPSPSAVSSASGESGDGRRSEREERRSSPVTTRSRTSSWTTPSPICDIKMESESPVKTRPGIDRPVSPNIRSAWDARGPSTRRSAREARSKMSGLAGVSRQSARRGAIGGAMQLSSAGSPSSGTVSCCAASWLTADTSGARASPETTSSMMAGNEARATAVASLIRRVKPL